MVKHPLTMRLSIAAIVNEPRGMPKRERPAWWGRALPSSFLWIDQAVSTLAGSTFTPGPIVEVTATRWM